MCEAMPSVTTAFATAVKVEVVGQLDIRLDFLNKTIARHIGQRTRARSTSFAIQRQIASITGKNSKKHSKNPGLILASRTGGQTRATWGSDMAVGIRVYVGFRKGKIG